MDVVADLTMKGVLSCLRTVLDGLNAVQMMEFRASPFGYFAEVVQSPRRSVTHVCYDVAWGARRREVVEGIHPRVWGTWVYLDHGITYPSICWYIPRDILITGLQIVETFFLILYEFLLFFPDFNINFSDINLTRFSTTIINTPDSNVPHYNLCLAASEPVPQR